MGGPALVSIHDLMPGTMGRVEELLALLARIGVPPVTLLVVPGLDWSEPQLQRLRELAAGGHELAAHGWTHRAREIRRFYHRLHSLLVSRDVAEHLALDPREFGSFLARSHRWFGEQGLPEPKLYVPPAWALGRITPDVLYQCPFSRIETTTGILFPASGNRLRLPLTGFEADTPLREKFLRLWNRLEQVRAARSGRPLRISIHPNDGHLRLADDMEALLRKDWQFIGYGDLAETLPEQGSSF